MKKMKIEVPVWEFEYQTMPVIAYPHNYPWYYNPWYGYYVWPW